ncbi:MAG TPA: RluA family pseudouridine synthase [Candidatus Binatia bacterium]|jgi:23S rRNA pseudouridine955/2504/2580 synthase
MPDEIIVPPNEEPKRLENFLKKRFNIGYVRKVFRKNGVRLNGRRSGPGASIFPGDRVELYIPFEKQSSNTKAPRTLPFKILFEDEDIIVIDKSAGIAVHEARGVLKRHTVLGMLETMYRPRGITPRLAHRIDKETSGLLVAVKNDAAVERLQTLFKERRVEKEYLALVKGKLFPARGTIDFPLPGREGRTVAAATHYKVEKEFSDTSLARVRIDSGRMHQIRLHFAELGHPVVMDDKHGNFDFNVRFGRTYGLRRQFLHAAMIAFSHRGKKQKWSAELPEELGSVLKRLESR